MTTFATDRLVFAPDDVDLARSPLAGHFAAETYVLGAFNPGFTRLPTGNLLMMVRVAEALKTPIHDGHVHAIRWEADEGAPQVHTPGKQSGHYVLDAWPLDLVDTADPRKFMLRGGNGSWRIMALTSLSWLLPVELSPDGLAVVAVHYDRAIAPHASFQCYGLEDARISRIKRDDKKWEPVFVNQSRDNKDSPDRWLMTTCSVSPERHATTLYSSDNGLDWQFEDIVLDHQNKDMLIFAGRIAGHYWAQTRPLGDLYFAYPPGSEWRAGPSINLASSPDALHWKPVKAPGIRPQAGTVATARMGGGSPPVRIGEGENAGWQTLWHGVEPKEIVGIYRTYWSVLDARDPSRVLRTSDVPLLEASPELTRPIEHQVYIRDVVFTTGIADGDDRVGGKPVAAGHYIVASGEGDLACRITHVPKAVFGA